MEALTQILKTKAPYILGSAMFVFVGFMQLIIGANLVTLLFRALVIGLVWIGLYVLSVLLLKSHTPELYESLLTGKKTDKNSPLFHNKHDKGSHLDIQVDDDLNDEVIYDNTPPQTERDVSLDVEGPSIQDLDPLAEGQKKPSPSKMKGATKPKPTLHEPKPSKENANKLLGDIQSQDNKTLAKAVSHFIKE